LNNYKQTYSPDDATLIKRCLQGNSNAWQTLVDRYGGLVHSVPVRHGLQPDEVDDVGQDTFLALAQNLHTIDKPESLGAWLVTTARRLSWRAIQKRRREAPVPEADLSDAFPKHIVDSVSGKMPSITELMDGWSNQEALAEALQKLGDRCRTLLTLLFLDQSEPSYEEVSQQLGISKGSIGPTRNRCLKDLRSIMEGLGWER